MRDDEFNSWLRSGASQLAASVHPPSPEAVRRRGDRRRHRTMVVSGVLAFAVGAGGGGVAYASLGQPGKSGPPAAAGSTSSPSRTFAPYSSAAASPAPAAGATPDVVAVSTAGSVELLSTKTGLATKVLVRKADAIGDEVAVSPDAKTVYYTVKSGCTDHIYSIPVTGGTPTAVTTGALPAVSPDGNELAFVREPYTYYPSETLGCSGGVASLHPGNAYSVVVRNLSTGSEKAYPADPGLTALPVPISHLSWSPSGGMLLVSIASSQDNEGWDLHVLNTATDRYFSGASLFAGGIPVTGSPGKRPAYYPEAVFQPDGDIFAVRVCCTGFPVTPSSILLQEITTSGTLVHSVASGFLDRVHSSLDAAPGKLLYLSGNTLFATRDGGSAKLVTGGLIAAAWLPAT